MVPRGEFRERTVSGPTVAHRHEAARLTSKARVTTEVIRGNTDRSQRPARETLKPRLPSPGRKRKFSGPSLSTAATHSMRTGNDVNASWHGHH